jgi:S-adenosylmethionine:tRNA ribosyltransferase-isomerase
MIAAARPIQRPPQAKLLVVDRQGRITHHARSAFVDLLRPGDVVVANDAATLPASLFGTHLPTGAEIEVRLAARSSLRSSEIDRFAAIVFGSGDYRTRTEDRPAPPPFSAGDRFALGPLIATVIAVLGHPRLVALRFDGSPDAIWAGLSRHGRPIQYAHMSGPLALWDVWTPIAAAPVAFEPPSAGFALNWRTIAAMRECGVRFATLTLAAGISSTGDAELDRQLPFDEPYRIPETTRRAVTRARAQGAAVVAVGTTVVRALEHAARHDGRVRAGEGVANRRVGPDTPLRVVTAVLSGTHEPDSSHYQLVRAFVDDETLRRADGELEQRHYRTHEFGDSVFVEQQHHTACGATRLRTASARPRRLQRFGASEGGKPRLRQGSGEVSPKRFARRRTPRTLRQPFRAA